MIPVKAFVAYTWEEEGKYNEESLYDSILNEAQRFMCSVANNDTLLRINYNIDKILWKNGIYDCHSNCGFSFNNTELIIKFCHNNGDIVYLDELAGKDVFCVVIR